MDEPGELARALGFSQLFLDEDRMRLLVALMEGDAPLSTLSARCGLPESGLARHLGVLEHAGLVIVLTDAGGTRYHFERRQFRDRRGHFFRTVARLGPALPEAASPDEVVLRRFVEGERLVQLPTRGEKLEIVLRWLAEKFRPGQRYPEAEVNQIIQRHHPDHASLRRYLVDHHLLRRERGIYWRP